MARHDNNSCRASEINQWLGEHPEILNYLILDDYDDHLSLNFQDRYVVVRKKELLTIQNVKSILKKLTPPLSL